MSIYDDLLVSQKQKLQKALAHLAYSYQKILQLPEDVTQLDEEELETWESFAARFCRVSDIFLTKYLRTQVLMNDPGFTGSLRDFVNQGEKLGILTHADDWMAIRELRNLSVQDYTEKDLTAFFKRLKEESPQLLGLVEK